MNWHSLLQSNILIASVLTLAPLLYAAFAPDAVPRLAHALPKYPRLLAPALLCIPYVLVARGSGVFRWTWFSVYLLLPIGIAVLMEQASHADPRHRGNWRDYMLLLGLGLAVDLRWLEPAWPAHLAVFGKILLLDAGIYGFLAVRQLDGVGFDLRLNRADLGIGLREFLFYAVLAIPLGLWLHFLHFHAAWPNPLHAVGAALFTFLFIAIPEELFFRGWLQNLLERRVGRTGALILTAVVFGLAHWNKRTTSFNYRYVLMAAIAGIFYGRAWRAQRRVGSSSITHATVDTLWSLWLR